MSGKHFQAAYELAEGQHGYFSITQTAAIGIPADRVRDMARRGVVERVTRGVYRVVNFPLSPKGQYVEAVLWPATRVGNEPGVLSHESALAFYELSDVNPGKVHITIAPHRRLWREPPPQLVVHRADIPEADVRHQDGVLVTTVARTIRDCAATHLGPALLRQALADARRTGWLRGTEADALTDELTAAGKL